MCHLNDNVYNIVSQLNMEEKPQKTKIDFIMNKKKDFNSEEYFNFFKLSDYTFWAVN